MGWFWAWVDKRWGERILFADEPRGWPGKLADADPAEGLSGPDDLLTPPPST